MENFSPRENVGFFTNAHNFQIVEQNNYIINGNQYIFTSDQATLIQLLSPILEASHTRDRVKSPPNSACFPGTRVEVIKTIMAWADSVLLWNTHVLWLYGFVGCGKSAIALAVALVFEERKRLVASFFFFRNTGDRSKMTRFATTLAFQLASTIPEAAPFIKKAITEEGVLGLSLVSQLRRLVFEPFKAATKQIGFFKTFLKPFLIVIDGLDECEDHEDVRAFIDDMLLFFEQNPFVPLRFLITSRVEQHIEGHLKNGQVRLENLVNHCSRGDLEAFIHTCFEEEKKRNPVIKAYIHDHGDWPTKEDKETLIDHIGGSFIFASTVFKYIIDPTDKLSTPMQRLPHTLDMNPGLDGLYYRTLSRSQDLPYFHEIVSTLALLFEPLPIVGIAGLLCIKTFEVVRVLVNLQAIIHIPGTDDLPVTICHTSLRDFLTTESRSGALYTAPYHLYLSYRYSLHDGKRRDTDVDMFSNARCADHLAKFISLPPTTRDFFPDSSQMLDSIYTYILVKSDVLVQNFSCVFHAAGIGAMAKFITREEMQSFKKVWVQFSNPKTGFLERSKFTAFFNRLSGIFEVRIYPAQYSIPNIKSVVMTPDPPSFPISGSRSRARWVYGMDLNKLENVLDRLDVAEIRRRKTVYARLYHEASISHEHGRGISLLNMLIMLARYKLPVYAQASMLDGLVIQAEVNKLVTDLVNLDKVRSLLSSLPCRRRFLRHLEKKSAVTYLQQAIPSIIVEETMPETSSRETQDTSMNMAAPTASSLDLVTGVLPNEYCKASTKGFSLEEVE
ncbi:hypothetical protein MD484_g6819, partial [Candolleomyces efflorescens]